MKGQRLPEPRFRLKLVPLIVVTLLALAPAYIGALVAALALGSAPLHTSPPLSWLYVQHALQLLIGLLLIALVKRWVPADYGLHWPRARTEFLPAVLWGALFGVIMTLVDYAPQLLARTHPDLGYPLTPGAVSGWMFFESVYVGPTEDPLPRAARYLPRNDDAREASHRTMEHELGGRDRRDPVRTAARFEFQPAKLAARLGSADLRLHTRCPVCLLAREIPECRGADHRPQSE